jgi:hypothetical protein
MCEVVPNIALRAYQLWDAAGRPEGRSDEFYFQAEEEFRELLEGRRPKEADDRMRPKYFGVGVPNPD